MAEFILVGRTLDLMLALVILMMLAFLRIQWRCGLCGKTLDTNIVSFFLCYCDHDGTS